MPYPDRSGELWRGTAVRGDLAIRGSGQAFQLAFRHAFDADSVYDAAECMHMVCAV